MTPHTDGACDLTAVPLQRTGDLDADRHVAGADMSSAVERYREIIGIAAEAIGSMRARDEERVADLIAGLAQSQDRMAEIIERGRVVELGANLHWESAVGALWDERWMTMSPKPRPDESVPVRDQREYNTAMDVAFLALEDSLQKRYLLRRKKD